MLVFTFLPIVKINGADLTLASSFNGLTGALSGEMDLLKIVTSLLFIILFLTCIINFFKCFGKLGWLSKRSTRYVNGYNRNMRAMEKMGKLFSCSFATFIILYVLIFFLNNVTKVEDSVKMNVYMILGVGLVIHFFGGLIGGKVSFFNVGGPNSDVEEEPRQIGLFVYFFRNLVQVAVVAVVIFFFAQINHFGELFVSGKIMENMQSIGMITIAIEAVALISLFVMIKHATNITEYNRFGIEGQGMKNFRLFSFFLAIAFIVYFALAKMTTMLVIVPDKDNLYLYIIIAAVVGFIVDCVFKTRNKEEEYPVEEYPVEQRREPRPMPVNQPMMPGMPTNGMVQPIYVPVYYPIPAPQPMPHGQRGCPAPRPNAYARPMPMQNPTACPMMQPMACPMQKPVQQPVCPMTAKAMPMQPAMAAQMPQKPFGLPPAVPVAAPVEEPKPFVRPEPAPAPEHLQAKPCDTSESKTKKELRKAKKEEKAQAKFLKKSKKSAKQAKKLEKKVEKEEKKLAKKNKKNAKKNKNKNKVLPVQEVQTEAAIIAPPVDIEPREYQSDLDPQKSFKVRCPKCGKELFVKDVSPYHRCPVCSNVFSLRKFEAFVPKRED